MKPSSNLNLRAYLSALFAAIVFSFLPGVVDADDPELQFTLISSHRAIVDIANAGDGSGRLFLVEQPGRIFINKDGEDPQSPFLDIRSRVMSTENEQGLLSVAFPPDHETSGFFYVWYTLFGGNMVLSRFKVTDDPDIADAQSEIKLLTVAQPFGNHNGGRLQFGPDGMLYLGIGDGGGAFDPDEVGQDGSTLLGKLIRIDVDPMHGSYAIPSDNPYVGSDSVRNEIWARGLRNPWKISFDSGTGDLFVADVGQNQLEEVNFQPTASPGGENYGWSVMEGSQCVGGGVGCDQSGLTLPVAEYDHNNGCSITGGEVYRGTAYPNMTGMYFYGDYCSGNIWGLTRDGNQWSSSLLADTSYRITTFGLDEEGGVYVVNQNSGIFKLSDGPPKPEPSFAINAGFNDAWFNPATSGQGFFIIVFEETGIVFLAWFTYDVERPPADVSAILGEPGHRWITAQGPYQGDSATLDVFVSSGGVFDSAVPVVGPPVKDGTMTIKWTGCNAGVLTYDIPSIGMVGSIPIERIVLDNVPLCEALQ